MFCVVLFWFLMSNIVVFVLNVEANLSEIKWKFRLDPIPAESDRVSVRLLAVSFD